MFNGKKKRGRPPKIQDQT
ncbi:MAG: hypothetical protein EU544_01005 [Promethearchaeota archaeon]|nr:MAG: hypothetical protein EU544_01005 [Candidatus Lokiarchaeota archaeon]